ncbi:membrane associated rhomboid family serine protease [Pedobacter psychrotolerans]|uniref:Membrane associated rhomboid family serine protease n=1 Tax=Pedobacter psychrotolerans TaxID=1843235 RepID=A0A4R2HJR3_9SPHI|nr:rhomboid family intramembrane serine protease [Pedobacter psychrotolerans]TCO29076.1 membrane associated rhomboid family serine protease [Pedobacter psychrotolerans]GGE53974.1 rhomboid family intramembrane serine protease [Pedobacter psychrotolerans]
MNNTFKDLKFKIFQSGNPLFLYIGLNTIIFLVTAILSVFLFLAKSDLMINEWIRDYFGVPAAISALPTRFYTVITYMFFHDGFLHLLFNMLGLFWFGNIFMNFLKSRQFHFVYLAGGIIGALIYIAGLNIFPAFAGGIIGQTVIGSSAAVMAIIVATATLVPNYTIMMMLIGEVKIKWVAIVYFFISFIGLSSANAGGNLAHIGGAILGFAFIKSLQSGRDWSKLFERKPKLRVVKNDKPPVKKPAFKDVSQQEIDAILDKISSSGYDKLTATEREKLFKASKD